MLGGRFSTFWKWTLTQAHFGSSVVKIDLDTDKILYFCRKNSNHNLSFYFTYEQTILYKLAVPFI